MIEIETMYTREIYKEFFWFSMFRGKYYRYGRRGFSILTIVMPILALISAFLIQSTFSVIVSIIGIGCIALLYAIVFFGVRFYVSKAPGLFQSPMKYIFHEAELYTEQAGDVMKGTGKAEYEAFYKAYETKEAFYLYISPSQAYLLTKGHFIKGSPDELRELLQTKLNKKFIICK